MRKSKTMEHSTSVRQAIIELCHKNGQTVNDMGSALSMNSKNINHHLLTMIKEGYIQKKSKFTKINGAWANVYVTLKHEPYVWAERKSNIALNKVDVVIDYEPALMKRMGYTNIIPARGQVHLGLLSKG
jgi:predicted ArsR family transcriptional regulator